MVFGQAVGDRLAKIVQEPVGDFVARNDPAGEDRQIRTRVVAAELRELVEKPVRPVRETDLPAVVVDILQTLADQGPGILTEHFGHRLEVLLHGRRVQPVQLEALAARAGATDAAPVIV